jgi:hypothetical protein
MGRQSSGSDQRKLLMDRDKWSPTEVCPTSGLDTAPARTGSAGFQPASRAGGSMPPARDLRRGSRAVAHAASRGGRLRVCHLNQLRRRRRGIEPRRRRAGWKAGDPSPPLHLRGSRTAMRARRGLRSRVRRMASVIWWKSVRQSPLAWSSGSQSLLSTSSKRERAVRREPLDAQLRLCQPAQSTGSINRLNSDNAPEESRCGPRRPDRRTGAPASGDATSNPGRDT